jgi:hypothetical protein
MFLTGRWDLISWFTNSIIPRKVDPIEIKKVK